jgi:hypothetical protein
VPREIIIDLDAQPDRHALVHRVRNFGEDLYRACREDGWAEISLAEVDRATNQLIVKVGSARRERRIAAMIQALLAKHFFTGKARVSHVHEPN